MKKILLLVLFLILPAVSFAQTVPTISNIGQYKLDGVTPLDEGATTNEQSVVFSANVASAAGRPVKLQVELKKTNWDLYGYGPFLESGFVPTGSIATTTKEYIADGLHHWQYRTVDDLGNTSDWQEYGMGGNTDFVRTNSVPIPVPVDVKTEYSIGFNPSSLVFDNINSSLWLLNNSDNTISQMAVSDGSFVGSPHPVGNAVSSMIFDDVSQSVWALSVGSWEEMSTLSKMSAQDGSVVARYTVGKDSRHLAFDKNTNSIWVVNGNPMEPSFSKVGIFSEPSALETIPALLPFSDLIAFDDSTRTVWATQWDMDNGIYGTSIDTNVFAGYIGTFSIGHRALLYENFTRSLWVDGVDEESSAGYLQLDPSAQKIVGRYSVGDGYGGIVFDSVNKSMWTASGTFLTRINLVTKEVTNYDLPGIGLAAYDSTTNSLWATLGTNMISKISVEKLLLAKVPLEQPLNVKAAELAKQLVNENYLWGGKGWDMNDRLFVNTDTVKNSYNFWNPLLENNGEIGGVDTGDGVDCSGLVAWSYNRTNDPLKYFTSNFIKYESADSQRRYNTHVVAESDLQPGDLLFFDPRTYHADTKTWSVGSDGVMDHVAMYVGGSDDKNIVHARSTTYGIQYASLSLMLSSSTTNGFAGFGRPENTTIAMAVSKYSPVHFSVTDPDGNTISDSVGIVTDEEYIQSSGDLTYISTGVDANGYPEGVIYSPVLKQGEYKINVSPMTGVSLDHTYSLEFTVASTTITLAQNIPLSQIPSTGYGVVVSDTNTLTTFIPVMIDIKPGSTPNSINLGSNGVVPVAIYGNNALDVHQIDPLTIKLANASVRLKGNGQPMVSYSDINNDGFLDITVQVSTQALQLTSSDIRADLSGKLYSGVSIGGSDSIRVVP